MRLRAFFDRGAQAALTAWLAAVSVPRGWERGKRRGAARGVARVAGRLMSGDGRQAG
jgi:hypothetical protein